MPDQTSQYKIQILRSTQIILAIQSWLGEVFNLFSLKRSRHFWGVVYDSVSKQPLDPVIVKLLYADGREVGSGITDLNGHYGFLASPGKFKIFAKKTNYIFPSRYVTGEQDGLFENVYHGEFFELSGDEEVVAPNIPMDSQRQDWNQQAKAMMQKSFPYLGLLLKRTVAAVFWFGLALCLIALWLNLPQVPRYLSLVVVLYGVIIILAVSVKEPRLWGRIILGKGIKASPDIFLQLKSEKIEQIVFGTATIADSGKFLLRASPGKYLLAVYSTDERQQKVQIGSIPVRVSKLGVFNSSLLIVNAHCLPL